MSLGMGGLAPLSNTPISCPGAFPVYWPEQKDKERNRKKPLVIINDVGLVIPFLPGIQMPEA